MNNIKESFVPLPITPAARQTAGQFASGQPTSEKAEQVRLNTLAVWVVNDYLQLMGIPTNLNAGDSWNPIVRLCADVADLEITGLGRLECRPLKTDSTICPMPPEVWEDRIGYVVVQIDESEREGTLLGFSSSVATEELPISRLQPTLELLTRLYELKQPQINLVNLSQWVEGVFATGWQAVEELLSPTELSLAMSFRTTEIGQTDPGIVRAKLINLGMESSCVLLMEINPVSDRQITIRLKVHPTGKESYLPPDIQLLVLDESKEVFDSATSRSRDNYIQLLFDGEPGEIFSVTVAKGDTSVTEDFMI